MISLTAYITRRLGYSAKDQAINFLAKPFGAASFTEFWQYWNPVWGYYLHYYGYRPLRKHLSRPIAVLMTFFVCGLAHDLPFVLLAYAGAGQPPLFTLTVFFSLIGSLVIVTEKVRFQFAGAPVEVRWIIHGAVLMVCYQMAVYVTAQWAKILCL
ncbi:MAG: hypothetical protein Fur0044_50450 [Anaerolineae bacterium]